EVVDLQDGRCRFQSGITTYPPLGSLAHRIRSRDLAAVHDLGDCEGAEIGTLSQDGAIPATVSIERLLSRHFAVLGTTGVGKSSA
ncbi:ATP-binding protein, partial [Pseudomonas aeruginosa]|uniref:helicase HerA domain-containing protein n=1 Tax=Pseudomonas aeruginosa TaxID=287 RepID=UPI001F2B7090